MSMGSPSFDFDPLTPTAFLDRSARVHADRVAIVDGDRTFTYREFADRSRRLAQALRTLGAAEGTAIAGLCANSHVMLELHHAVPLTGAALVPLNTRLSVQELDYILEHCGARVLVATDEHAELAREAARRHDIRVITAGGTADEYEELLAAPPLTSTVTDERALLSINYTSGTTGRPKGVMYQHRGAYLQALAMVVHAGLNARSRYLWTLPMFHCHGWAFTWAVTAAGGQHICLRKLDPDAVIDHLSAGTATHFCGAPTVLTMIREQARARGVDRLPYPVRAFVGGAPPNQPLLESLSRLGISVTHLYGMTETYGPMAINEWQPEWDERDESERARLNARQGVGNIVASAMRVIDTQGQDVPADGTTIGEIVCRGNNITSGYFRDPDGTVAATTADGWFRTGDLAVMHPDGYIEIKDRLKDIIISGGENISSVEVEAALQAHPAVIECAVVGQPDPKWGETPVAVVHAREPVDEQELIDFLRGRLAGYKIPRRYIFSDLPRTSTGKIQKNVLRESLRRAAESGDGQR
jgi:fatty-acyl-CoA synthase